ncbi:kit ligand isoform 2-T2 [Discoglossus pictus]
MKKTKTWIITCIYLQLLLICFGSPCGNPITDAVNDIDKLVGNLPNDYIMTLNYVPLKEALPRHCWLYLMVNEVSIRLDVLTQKFSNSSQNYFILSKLSLIFYGIRNCLQLNEHMDFIEEYSMDEGTFYPQQFFKHVTSTIEVFKDINNTDYDRTCVLPTTNSLEDDLTNWVTKQELQYVPSILKNNSSRSASTDKSENSSGSPLQWTSIASIALSCLIVGFLFGGFVSWKVKHRRAPARTGEHVSPTEENTELKSDRLMYSS